MDTRIRVIKILCVAFLILVSLDPCTAPSQIIGYESFQGLQLGEGIGGGGIDSTGWSDDGWQNAEDPRFSIVEPTPPLEFQIEDGAFIHGGDRALQLNTQPEPVPEDVIAFRSFAGTNSSIWFSFLIRPLEIGGGTDSFEIPIKVDGTTYGLFKLRPNILGDYIKFQPIAYYNGNSNSSGILTPMYPNTTYLVVGTILREHETAAYFYTAENPNASENEFGMSGVASMPKSKILVAFGIKVTSSDIGGPTSKILIDEIRIGYSRKDVILARKDPPLVPFLDLQPAVRLRWMSAPESVYQVQYSYELGSWINSGPRISGDGTMLEAFDISASENKYWRVQIIDKDH